MARAYVSLDDLQKLSHRAQGFSFLPRQPVHSLLTGRHASRLRGRGLDFDELRHYYEGDDTRTIDWAATARLGTPYVRVYREERDRPVLLLVDQRVSMFFGSKRATKSVVAAEVAALSAFRVASRAAQGQVPQEALWPTRSWTVSTPEEQGMDSAGLARLIESTAGATDDASVVMVMVHQIRQVVS